MISLLAPAKVNLFLEVKNRRPDGYHNIDTVFHAVQLFDKLKISPNKNRVTFSSNDRTLPVGDKNLVIRAANLLKKTFRVKRGAKIYLEKNIPIGGGLGGGSSDAAAALKGLIKLWKLDVPDKLLKKLAKQLGADVAFFLEGRTCSATGIGDRLKKIAKTGKSWFVLVYPGFESLTKKAYSNLKFPLTNKQKINKILNCLKGGYTPANCGNHLFNRLEAAVFPFYPELESIKKSLNSMGLASLMSGSGSTVFGVASNKKDAEGAIKRLNKKPEWKTWVVRSF
jgi:4-diphosphocytidyl-2-C-methyl-D-erythritol kinase